MDYEYKQIRELKAGMKNVKVIFIVLDIGNYFFLIWHSCVLLQSLVINTFSAVCLTVFTLHETGCYFVFTLFKRNHCPAFTLQKGYP